MKNYKIYRVVNDTRKSHGMVNNYAKLHGEAANDHLWLKETKTGVYFLCHKSDVKEATAEYVTKVHAVCTRTGNLANYSFRKNDNDKLVMLGETEEYEPLSRAAYFNAIRENMIVKDAEHLNDKD